MVNLYPLQVLLWLNQISFVHLSVYIRLHQTIIQKIIVSISGNDYPESFAYAIDYMESVV